MIKNFLFYGIFFCIGLFFIDTILELASYPYDVLIGIGMMLGFIYLARNEKDSIVHTLKEVHQSNLDDIDQKEKEASNT
jgi:hypothetical protein